MPIHVEGMPLDSHRNMSESGRSGRSRPPPPSTPGPSVPSSGAHQGNYDARASPSPTVPTSSPSGRLTSRASHSSHAESRPSSPAVTQLTRRSDTPEPVPYRTLGLQNSDFRHVPMRSLGELADLYLTSHGYSLSAQRFVLETYSTVSDEATFVSVLGRRGVPDSELSFLYGIISGRRR